MGKPLVLMLLAVLGIGTAVWMLGGSEDDEVVPTRRLTIEPSQPSARPPDAASHASAPRSPDAARVEAGVVALAAAGELRGRVVDGGRVAIGGVRIEAAAGPQFTAVAVSDASGQFGLVVPMLADGWRKVDLVCRHVLFVEQHFTAIVGEAMTTDLGDLVLPAASGVAGIVVDADGNPLAANVWCVTAAPLPWPPESFAPTGTLLQQQGTGVDGRFRIGGLPAGRVRLWAQKPGWSNGWTRPFAVEVGQEAFDVRIVMRPEVQDHFVRGVVVGPDGEAVANARIAVALQHLDHSEMRTALTVVADERGEFKIPPALSVPGFRPDWRRVRATLVISDPAARYRRGHAETCYGAPALRVQLARQREVVLRVHGAGGRPLPRPTIQVLATLAATDESTLANGLRTASAEGEVRIGVPSAPFQLRIGHLGHETITTGPYAADVAGPIAVDLSPSRGIRGRVTAHGTPLRGARVWLQYEFARDRLVDRAGMACLHDAEHHAETEVDADGRFVLPFAAETAYRVYLYAAHPEYATGQLGPIESRDVASAPRDFELTPGGSLVGTVHHGGDETARRRVVRVHNGDTHPRYVPVTADGGYRVPRLRPGRYKVDVVDPPGGTSAVDTRDMPVGGLPFDVEVVAGQEVRFDIVLQPTSFVLRLELASAAGALELANGQSLAAELRDGALTFARALPGRAHLRLQSPLADEHLLSIECDVFLRPGATAVELQLPMATLRGALAPSPTSRLRYRWRAGTAVAPWAAGPVSGSVTAPLAGPSFRLTVPAGAGTLLVEAPGDGSTIGARELGTFELAIGSEREVSIDASGKR